MRARVSKIILGLALAAFALTGCSAGTTTGVEHIADFGISYTIEPSGTVHAVEMISYDFGGQSGKHGIDRYLATRFSTEDGQERVYRYTNLAVSSPSGAPALHSTSEQYSLHIRVGNANETVHGTQVYRLSYDIVGAINRARPSSPPGRMTAPTPSGARATGAWGWRWPEASRPCSACSWWRAAATASSWA